MRIVPMSDEHADAVLSIYQAGIDEGDATFETAAPTWGDFDRGKLPEHRFVALGEDGAVLGWVAVVPVSDRCVYAGVVEHSVYVAPQARGRGVGRALLDALIASTDAAGIWTIQSGIFPENAASVALHRAAGFRVVGVRERIGQQHGRWRDVVFMERRSQAAGGDADDIRAGVLAAEEAYDRAWNAGDVEALVACLTRDAVLVSPRGQVAQGRDMIREVLGRFLDAEAKGSRHVTTMVRMSFAGEGVAVFDGQARITRAEPPMSIEHPFTDILVRDGGTWLIAHVRAYHFDPDI